MPDIRHSIAIDAAPEQIHPLVASGEGFSKWWAAYVREDRSSQIVEIGFFSRTTVYQLKLTRIVAPQEAEWLCQTGKEWTGTKLCFKLTQKDRGTLLEFMHTDWESETSYFISCNTTWGELMFRVRGVAEGKTQEPLFPVTDMGY